MSDAELHIMRDEHPRGTGVFLLCYGRLLQMMEEDRQRQEQEQWEREQEREQEPPLPAPPKEDKEARALLSDMGTGGEG